MFSTPVFIINRESEVARYEACHAQLRPFFKNIYRFPAFTADFAETYASHYFTYDVFDNIEVCMKNENIIPTWAAGACALSHYHLWRFLVYHTDFSTALIVEDDLEIVSPTKFKYKFNEILHWLRLNQDGHLLKNNEKAQMLFQLDGLKLSNTYFLTGKENAKLSNLKKTLNDYMTLVKGKTVYTHAYVMNREACTALLPILLPIKYQLDIELSFLAQKKMDQLNYLHIHCHDAGTRQNRQFPSQVQYCFYTFSELATLFRPKHIPEPCIRLIHEFLPTCRKAYTKQYNCGSHYSGFATTFVN
jgi:GR25 family glycosyltransferase involved in LPS biosynthesis